MTRWADVVSGERYAHGESPRWDARRGEAFWVDMATGTLHVGLFREGALREVRGYSVAASIGCAVPSTQTDGWVVATERSFCHVDTDGRVSAITSVPDGSGIMNDGLCDTSGRFWAGTKSGDRVGSSALYTLECDATVRVRLRGVTISNGICFSADGSRVYYVDTLPRRSIDVFDLEPDGGLGSRRTLLTVADANPDGMTIDEEGCLWVAMWDAGEVRRYSPQGELLDTILVPTRRPTAVALLGRSILITTASSGIAAHDDFGGYIFAAHVDVGGVPARGWPGP